MNLILSLFVLIICWLALVATGRRGIPIPGLRYAQLLFWPISYPPSRSLPSFCELCRVYLPPYRYSLTDVPGVFEARSRCERCGEFTMMWVRKNPPPENPSSSARARAIQSAHKAGWSMLVAAAIVLLILFL